MVSEARVILATENKELNEYIKGRHNVVAEIFYREALEDAARRTPGDVAVFSAYLPGHVEIPDVVLKLRAADVRVIFLAGDLKRGDPILPELVAQGVYDVLFNPVNVTDIEERIQTPGTFGQALRLLAVPAKPPPGRIATLLKKPPDAPAVEREEKPRPLKLPSVLPSQLKAKASRKESPREGQKAAGTEERGPGYTLHSNRPIVAVWSPVGAGKTFVATALAFSLAEGGVPVMLVDLDPRRAVHSWLCLPDGEDSLVRALEAPLMEEVPPGLALTDNLEVYTADPAGALPAPAPDTLGRVFNSNVSRSQVVVVDLPSALPRWGEEVLAASSAVVLVSDPDYSHVHEVKRALELLRRAGRRVMTVANRYAQPVGVPYWSADDIFGSKADVTIPCAPEEIYQIAIVGKPNSALGVMKPINLLAMKVMTAVSSLPKVEKEEEPFEQEQERRAPSGHPGPRPDAAAPANRLA
ncbi:MAG: nucleotide-binding protein [Desulfobacteria bacterium]